MEPEIEKFEITEWDLENEFNPNRIRRPQSKHKQIYGIWADDDSDDERPSFSSKGKKDLSAPISFISGGIKKSGQKEEEKGDGEESDENSSSEEESVQISHKSRYYQRNSFGGRGHSMAGIRGSDISDREFGGWEKYTKGIGARLLLQMGYQPGKGLGKDLQGITTPIEAKQRKGKGAIGLYGPEHKQKPTVAAEIEEDKEPKVQLHQWKKQDGESQKTKYIYRTIDDVKSDSIGKKFLGDSSRLSKVKVIDMTGPEQKVFAGYHQIHQQHSKPEEWEDSDKKKERGHHFSLPELQHNLALLVEMMEQEIIRNDRELSHENDYVVNLKHEKERLAKVMEDEKKQIETLKSVMLIIDELNDRNKNDCDNPLTINSTMEILKKLQQEYYEEYVMYGLNDLAVAIVYPLMKKHLESWEPLKEPLFSIELFKEWQNLLEIQGPNRGKFSSGTDEDFDPYHQLMWIVWMPCVRKAFLSWNVRQCDSIIELLENWMPLLPGWIMDNILEQLILPRLQKEVEDWNPLTDTMPIHAWLHPWLPLMGNRLQPLYAPIRNKLAHALTNWHPSDCSAKLILEPWRAVFSRGTLEAFVVANIVPKLALVLQNFIINPHQQHLDVWHWVMAWEDIIPLPIMANLLEKNFFPHWQQVLCAWLTHNTNYEEVTKWYMGWKSMFSEALLNYPVIKEQFRRALDIMNRAVTSPQGLLSYQPGARESIAYLNNVERQEMDNPSERTKRDYDSIAQAIRGSSSAASLSMNFKDLIEKKAEEKNIIFMPVPNRFQEGKQVYRFGQTLLYLDRGVIFVFNEKTWVPTSLQTLLDTN